MEVCDAHESMCDACRWAYGAHGEVHDACGRMCMHKGVQCIQWCMMYAVEHVMHTLIPIYVMHMGRFMLHVRHVMQTDVL